MLYDEYAGGAGYGGSEADKPELRVDYGDVFTIEFEEAFYVGGFFVVGDEYFPIADVADARGLGIAPEREGFEPKILGLPHK